MLRACQFVFFASPGVVGVVIRTIADGANSSCCVNEVAYYTVDGVRPSVGCSLPVRASRLAYRQLDDGQQEDSNTCAVGGIAMCFIQSVWNMCACRARFTAT